MDKLKKLGRIELQTEMIACTHIVTMLIVYAFEQFIYNGGSASFWQILQIAVLGYAVAWGQTILFWGEKLYSKMEYFIRAICWMLAPAVLTVVFGILFHWFLEEPVGYAVFFYVFQLIYYVCFWCLLQVFFKKETKELNEWLSDIKKEDE